MMIVADPYPPLIWKCRCSYYPTCFYVVLELLLLLLLGNSNTRSTTPILPTAFASLGSIMSWRSSSALWWWLFLCLVAAAAEAATSNTDHNGHERQKESSSSSFSCLNDNDSNNHTDSLVPELSWHNFHATVSSHTWTLIWLYDGDALALQQEQPHEQRSSQWWSARRRHRQYELLQSLAREWNHTTVASSTSYFVRDVTLAMGRMNRRQHGSVWLDYWLEDSSSSSSSSSRLKHGYTRVGHGRRYETYLNRLQSDTFLQAWWQDHFHSSSSSHQNATTTTTNESPQQVLPPPPYMSSEWILMDPYFNIASIYSPHDEDEDYDDDNDDQQMVQAIRTWLAESIQAATVYVLQENKNKSSAPSPSATFKSFPRRPAVVHSKIERERHMANTARLQNTQQSSSVNQQLLKDSDWKEMIASVTQQRTKYLAKHQPKNVYALSDDDDDDDNNSESFFRYIDENTEWISRWDDDDDDDDDDTADIMEDLALLVERYLTWVHAYEHAWSTERRAEENRQTQYGLHVTALQEKVQHVFLALYGDLQRVAAAAATHKETPFFFPWTHDAVPSLQEYFQDMMFGYGRSPTSLREYLIQHNVLRRDNGNGDEDDTPTKTTTATSDLPRNMNLIQRIRDYVRVQEEVRKHPTKYKHFFRITWVTLYQLLDEFQVNLTKSWLDYQKQHKQQQQELRGGVSWTSSSLEVLRYDMMNPAHAELLTDYHEFQKRTVVARKPAVLSNVWLTKPYNYTLDFLSEKCGYIVVTNNIKQATPLGDRTSDEWGGLDDFVIPTTKYFKGAQKKITLAQFIQMSKVMDDLYLFDVELRDQCSQILFENSPYDPPHQQYFRIPAVLGRFDLIHKLPDAGMQSVYPTLFIGRKGTNTKVHIDAGATAFWLYLESGRKRWIIYDEAERPFLYQRLQSDSFIPDVLSLNTTAVLANPKNQNKTAEEIHRYFQKRYPLLSRARRGAYEIIQEPGDLVYIPPSCPHAVENLEDSVALGWNQVPEPGIANHLWHTIHQRLSSSPAHALAELELTFHYLLTDPEKAFSLVDVNHDDPLYTSLGAYLTQA